MPRELRLDYGGNSFRWFDTDEMLNVHGSSRLPGFLAQNIEQHFKVPVQFQVLCDLQGPLSTQDFQRVLSGDESPRLWLFDARYMGDDLRKQFERRQKADAQRRGATAAPPSEPVTWTGDAERSVDSDVLALGVAKLSETLERREQQVVQMLNHHAEEIQELQRELTAARPARPPDASALFAEKVNQLRVPFPGNGDAEDAVSFFDSMEHPHDKLIRDMDSEDAETSIQLLEAEEAMLLQSVQEALAKITSTDTPSTTWRSQPDFQAPQLDLTSKTERSAWSPAQLERWSESSVPVAPCRGGAEDKPRGSGPLPPLSSESNICQHEAAATEKLRQVQQELEEALATARKAQEEEKQSQQLLSHWQARATAAEEATKAAAQAETGQLKLQCQLEVEVALRNKDLEHAQEMQQLKDEMHQAELEHQADVFALRHRNGLLTEQEEWQQMEILLLRSQQMQSEKAQEQQVQDLQSSIEWERLNAELRCRQLDSQLSRERSEASKNKELGARLVCRDLEVCALETLLASSTSKKEAQEVQAQALRTAQEEAKKLAAELALKSEMLQKEEAGSSMHLAEIAQQGEEILASRGREEQLRQRVARLESELEEALAAARAKASVPAPEPVAEPAPKVSDYISTADDELDKCLEKEILELGPGVLKGNKLERTGPKRYKIGDQKIFMQLSDGRVTVRVGGAYIPLQQWTKELTAAGEQGTDDPFSALDAQSPFAAVR